MNIKLDRLLVAFATQYTALTAIESDDGKVTKEDLEMIKLLNQTVKKELMNEVNLGVSIINMNDKEKEEE